MGATIEIQRSQQAEAIEQQLLRARNRFNQVSREPHIDVEELIRLI